MFSFCSAEIAQLCQRTVLRLTILILPFTQSNITEKSHSLWPVICHSQKTTFTVYTRARVCYFWVKMSSHLSQTCYLVSIFCHASADLLCQYLELTYYSAIFGQYRQYYFDTIILLKTFWYSHTCVGVIRSMIFSRGGLKNHHLLVAIRPASKIKLSVQAWQKKYFNHRSTTVWFPCDVYQ